ncbi:MAG: hypothetical protein CMI54_01350 [Parcubacteria group bacterium]|nr:hypothetical protein [Parcubacteria group bacterium]|tara:strand:+ start:7091 stop:8539 length:1449 start_codon:yes stop_codon:yes gene_type:complete
MNKLQAYEKALTLYGSIFSQLTTKESRYFLSTLKHDFVFFLFALIWKRANLKEGSSLRKNLSIGNHFFPRNFNEWQFNGRWLSFGENNQELWEVDKNHFIKEGITKREGKRLAVLTYGLDLERAFNFQELLKERDIGTVIDWQGNLKGNPSFKIIKKSKIFNPLFFYFFIKNIRVLFKIYQLLKKECQTNSSLLDFLRYFTYSAFVSARIRFFLKILAKNKSIGTVILSDLDNTWGNSFLFWSHFYGFKQVVYPHGSPLIFNKNRYFAPNEFYIWTNYQENALKEQKTYSGITPFLPSWLKNIDQGRLEIRNKKNQVRRLAIITGMEENLEVSFSDREKIIDYMEEISDFASRNNLLVRLKSHKLLDWHRDYDNLAQKYECVTHVKERWKLEDLENIDLAILMNTSTTLALQLLFSGVPIITCKELISEILTKHFSVPYFQFVAKTKLEVQDYLGRLINDEEFYQKAQDEARSIYNSAIKKV